MAACKAVLGDLLRFEFWTPRLSWSHTPHVTEDPTVPLAEYSQRRCTVPRSVRALFEWVSAEGAYGGLGSSPPLRQLQQPNSRAEPHRCKPGDAVGKRGRGTTWDSTKNLGPSIEL